MTLLIVLILVDFTLKLVKEWQISILIIEKISAYMQAAIGMNSLDYL